MVIGSSCTAYCTGAWPTVVSILFFFSSRRRHTSSYGDWSSDVCSSDLLARAGPVARRDPERVSPPAEILLERNVVAHRRPRRPHGVVDLRGERQAPVPHGRSEERRVGKEGGTRRWGYAGKKRYRSVVRR